jgi:hypothetical protein
METWAEEEIAKNSVQKRTDFFIIQYKGNGCCHPPRLATMQ